MWTFYWTAAGASQLKKSFIINARILADAGLLATAAAAARLNLNILVCAAGFTLPFAMKAIIERYNPPEIQHPPTVREVRQQVDTASRSPRSHAPAPAALLSCLNHWHPPHAVLLVATADVSANTNASTCFLLCVVSCCADD